MDKSLLHIKLIYIYFLILALCHVSNTCSGFPGLGHTYPMGDIFMEYNTSTSLEITCVITNESLIEQNPNISSKLYFKKGNNNVSLDKIIRLNETSIKLVEENPEKMSNLYRCMLVNSSICLNTVVVGTKPQPVTDFKCIGYNYENLTCSWTPPLNYISTNYSLSYTFPKTRPGGRPTDCNVTDDKETGKKKCFWSLGSSPPYRLVQSDYNFTLKSENLFGSLEQPFLFDHWKNILASPPENLSHINSTTSSLFLTWNAPASVAPFPHGLEHRVLYQCNFGPKVWQNGGIKETLRQEKVYFNLTGLKHAHDVCDIRVSIRVKGADSEEMWSANSSVTALTNSTIPGTPPRVNIGSFQTDIVLNHRDIYVYWQQIPIEIRNAEHFQYIVTVNDASLEDKLTGPTSSYVKFSNMSLLSSYKFTIKSKNAEGVSKESAVVVVPPNHRMIGEPVSFTKVAFDNGLYKLSWEKPKRGAEYVQNYTLFWCGNEKDRPYQCTGYLNWTEVPADTTEHNITVSEDYTTQFAISANNDSSSSGMVWATCTVIHNKLITKIKDVWITHVGSRFIELGWKLDCADRSDSVKGYVIYYCPRAKGPACSKRMNITINNPYAVSGRVTELTPYTTYMLTVSVINRQGSESLESDPLYNTTYEDIPTEPYDLKATNITNSSITVMWELPKRVNGFLRNYEVHYNNNKLDTNQTTFTLENLQSDTVYNISISACTQSCSKRSIPISIATKIGRPGRVSGLQFGYANNTPILYWDKVPQTRRNNLYEIRIKYKSDNENVTFPIINTTENRYSFVNCGQDGKYSSYFVAVRAVNTDNKTKYYGDWSAESRGSCEQTKDSNMIWTIIIVVGCLVLISMALCSGRKLYVYYKVIKAIDVTMPPGLDYPQNDIKWPEPKTISPSDEEHLLYKTSPSQCGDSSGCSSGQESVSSDSGSSIANGSDSGTEQPRTPTDEEPKAPLMEINSLKSTDSSQPYVQIPERIVPWKINSVNSNGYSMYGIPDSNNSDIELMSVPKNNVASSPYMSCDQIIKPVEEPRSVNNTYVPLNNTQDKNPPYVLAATKNVIMPNLYYPNVIPNESEKAYVQVADVNGVFKGNTETVETPQIPDEDLVTHNSNGYISYGDVSKATPEINTTSSYVPHRPYDITALKND